MESLNREKGRPITKTRSKQGEEESGKKVQTDICFKTDQSEFLVIICNLKNRAYKVQVGLVLLLIG